MYQSPTITSYSGKDLFDLMGPVETSYCDISNATVSPPFFLLGKDDVEVCFDIGECRDFETVTFSLIDSSNRRLGSSTFRESDGTSRGTVWCVDYDFGFAPDPGTYRIEIVATDSSNMSSDPIFVTFQVLGSQAR